MTKRAIIIAFKIDDFYYVVVLVVVLAMISTS